jgi:O-antigen ligase
MIISIQLSKRLIISRILDVIGHGFIVALPIAMVLANRSSPLFLSCAAIFVAAAHFLSGNGASFLSALQRMHTGAFIGLLGAVAYALLSLVWTVRPEAAFLALGEAVIPISAGAILIIRWRIAPPPKWLFETLAKAMLIAAGLIALELLLNFPLRQAYGGRLGPYVHNRPVVTLLLLLWPVLSWALLCGRKKLSLILLSALMLVVAISDSEAAKLGLLAAAGTSILVYFFPERISRILIVGLLGFIWIQPIFGDVVAHLAPPRLIELTKAGHSKERIEIWQAFGEVARKHPVIGTGFASTASMKDHPVVRKVARGLRRPLRMGHPHNAYLQVWVELGVPGALILSWFTLWGMRRLSEQSVSTRRMGLSALMCASAIALVSHGAWQGWWIAALTLVAALFSIRQNGFGHSDECFLKNPEVHPMPDRSVGGLTASG